MNTKKRKQNKKQNKLLYVLIVVAILLIKAVSGNLNIQDLENLTSLPSQESQALIGGESEAVEALGQSAENPGQAQPSTDQSSLSEEQMAQTPGQGGSFSFQLEDIPEYSGQPYIVLNNNIPSFTEDEITTASFELYGDLDDLGRCTVAYANVGTDLMPTEKRGSISSVKPTGWHSVQYDNVDGKSLYNRCHLIGFQLTGENANKQNLITGTRYLNVIGMLPFEDMIADYVKETNNHVLYRVTPIFQKDYLVADGVQMEGWSVEDNGEGICFHIFAYNVQPGIGIDYATGDSWLEEEP